MPKAIPVVISFALLNIAAGLTGCGSGECYSSDLQLRAAYERCFEDSYVSNYGFNIRSFICSTRSGEDQYADFYFKTSNGYCRTYNGTEVKPSMQK
jgi:hypothetical protein